MPEIFEHIDQLGRAPGRVAVATLVNTRGTTPRKEGAKMLVGEGGGVLGSVTIGGCVDAQVIEETADVLDKNRPRLLELNLGDEEAWEIGLTCGGTIEVFVEPLTPELYLKVREHAARGGHAAIVTRLDSGAKLLLLDDGTSEGTLGEAFLDERFGAEARDAMAAIVGPEHLPRLDLNNLGRLLLQGALSETRRSSSEAERPFATYCG